MLFSSLNVDASILKALKEEGYTTPTPIQAQAIPIVLEQTDLLGCAQTGTGKTAAFAIPILQLLDSSKKTNPHRGIRSLILTPTRELAIQISESFSAYGRHLKVSNTVVFGGVKQHAQVAAIDRGVDVLIATPGRLLDLINQRIISLNKVEIFVLDEADRMLDMGFIHDVKKVISLLPKQRQTLFFSATMPKEIASLANSILNNPKKVSVTPVSSTAEKINQFVYFVDRVNKADLLVECLYDRNIKSALVFTKTKHGADKLVKVLNKADIKSEAIHGNKTQNARQNALNNFKTNRIRVLVATDIAARGIDIDELEFVFNFELPDVAETYVHRVGRTGRAGANGTAYAFCDATEKPLLKDIERLIGKLIDEISDHPYPLQDHNAVKPVKQPFNRNNNNFNGNGRNNNNNNTNKEKKPFSIKFRQGSPKKKAMA